MSSAASTKSVIRARKNLDKFLRTLDTVPYEELEKSAKVIRTNAVAQTPYRTGKLERSVYSRVIKLGKDRFTLSAGANAFEKGYNYAAIQHEAKGFRHPVKGKAFYIRDPFNQEVRNLKRRLLRKLKVKSNGS